MPARITLRDIAQKAGVHISTVSLALRNSPKLRPAMRDRIQSIATQIGYTPDPGMAALVAHRRGVRAAPYQSTIAWLDNWPRQKNTIKLRDITSFNDYYLGASERAAQFGYKLEEFALRAPGMTPARMGAIFRARNIQGIISPPQEHDGNRLDFDFTDFTAVALGYSLRPARLHVITNHQFLSAKLLVTRLHESGYRRIGLCLCEDWDNKVNNGYTAGFDCARRHLPGCASIPPFLTDCVRPAELRVWMKQHAPDVIITQGISQEMIDWFEKDFGLRVPRDIGIANLSAHTGEPHITGILQNDYLVGATAVDVLAGMLQRNERGLPKIIAYTLVDGTWYPGATIRRSPATKKTSPALSII